MLSSQRSVTRQRLNLRGEMQHRAGVEGLLLCGGKVLSGPGAVKDECVSRWIYVALPFSSSVRPGSGAGAEDQASSVPGGPSGLWDLERGLLPGRSLVRLVDGTRHRLGGRLASRLGVGLPAFNPHDAFRCPSYKRVYATYIGIGHTYLCLLDLTNKL